MYRIGGVPLHICQLHLSHIFALLCLSLHIYFLVVCNHSWFLVRIIHFLPCIILLLFHCFTPVRPVTFFFRNFSSPYIFLHSYFTPVEQEVTFLLHFIKFLHIIPICYIKNFWVQHNFPYLNSFFSVFLLGPHLWCSSFPYPFAHDHSSRLGSYSLCLFSGPHCEYQAKSGGLVFSIICFLLNPNYHRVIRC